MDFHTEKWNYINEGNVHIVLQITNTDYVLRLVKEEEKPVNLQITQNAVQFVNLVMVPLICDIGLYQEEIIEISSKSLVYLSAELAKVRPEHRQIKSTLSKFAIKAPNLTLISQNSVNYCLEIKPKEGFRSASFNSLPKCYYCLKQFLKLQDKQINAVSNYCPLDLFSGDRKRMKTALLSLLNNPQNNFKMFKNGEMIYNEKSNILKLDNIVNTMNMFSSTNLFLDFVIDILLSKGQKETILSESEAPLVKSKSIECIENSKLERNTFLYKLLKLQKLSENLTLDIENIKDSGLSYVSTILEELKSKELQLGREIDWKEFLENTKPLHLALISAVAKDCSIMISFTVESIDGFPYIKVGGNKISYRILLTDLEPKPVTTLIKRKNTEKKLIELYQKCIVSSESP
ncbi:inositol-pentakisphosphate 2-kinase-like isoform X1 [Epargyreus clarus]|uniref:inositol-pentakisphosphate 2-kinase-like isoform X1 n=1 Tax=Epargyreus clarus TaxID=520877 RepID=UPI003C2CF90A